MALLSGIGISQGSGLVGTTVGAAENVVRAGKGAVDSIGQTIGIGPGVERQKSLPEGVPRSPQIGGPTAGSVYASGTGNGVPFEKSKPWMELHPGLYNYDDLSAEGLQDQISGVKVEDGFEVWLYKGVEGGQPAGDHIKIEGPQQIPELRDFRPGFENAISAIAVREKGALESLTGSDATTEPIGQGQQGQQVQPTAIGSSVDLQDVGSWLMLGALAWMAWTLLQQ